MKPMRDDANYDVDGKIFVGGLAPDVDDSALEKLFARYGRLDQAIVIKDKETKESRKFGFVTFKNPDDAADAIRGVHGKVLNGSSVRCQPATKPKHGGYPAGSKEPSRDSYGPPRGGGGDYVFDPRRGGGDRGFGPGRGGGGDRGPPRGGDRFRDGGRPEVGYGGDANSYGRPRHERDSYPPERAVDRSYEYQERRGPPAERRDYPPERRDYLPEQRDARREPHCFPGSHRDEALERRELAGDRSAFREERPRDYGSSRAPERREPEREFGYPQEPAARGYPAEREYPAARAPADRDYPPSRAPAARDYPPSRGYPDEREMSRPVAREAPSYGNGRDYQPSAQYEREARAPSRPEPREVDRYPMEERRPAPYDPYSEGSRAPYGSREAPPSRDLPPSRGSHSRGPPRDEPRGPPGRGPPSGREPPRGGRDPYASYESGPPRQQYPPRRPAGPYGDEPDVKRPRGPPSYPPHGGGRYGR